MADTRWTNPPPFPGRLVSIPSQVIFGLPPLPTQYRFTQATAKIRQLCIHQHLEQLWSIEYPWASNYTSFSWYSHPRSPPNWWGRILADSFKEIPHPKSSIYIQVHKSNWSQDIFFPKKKKHSPRRQIQITEYRSSTTRFILVTHSGVWWLSKPFSTQLKLTTSSSLNGESKADWNSKLRSLKTNEKAIWALQSIFWTIYLSSSIYLKITLVLGGPFSKELY